MPLPTDVHEGLVQVPDITHLSFLPPELAGARWAELLTPLPDSLPGDHDASPSREFLGVSEAQSTIDGRAIQPDR
jgi:hypothetical protein